MAEVKAGDRVRVHYTGRLTDGQVFDSSDGRDPLEFTAGGPEEAKQGDQLQASSEDGQQFTVFILEFQGEEAVLDGNHPLAGQTLEFDLHLLEIIAA